MESLTQNISQFFYYIAGGIGLLLAGIAALIGLTSWSSNIKDRRIKQKTKELKKKYPIEKHGKTFELVRSSANPRPVYLIDKNTNIKHWIRTGSTFKALDYDSSMVTTIDLEKFESFKEGNIIIIE